MRMNAMARLLCSLVEGRQYVSRRRVAAPSRAVPQERSRRLRGAELLEFAPEPAKEISVGMSDTHVVETDQSAREASGSHPYGRYLEEFEVGAGYKHWPAEPAQ